MSIPGHKTFAFRRTLRQSLEALDWRSFAWARHVLAAECVQGWAGRKSPQSATMLYIYCTQYLTTHSTTELANFLQQHGLPPFNLIPVREYSRELSANRLSKCDTQDRFWLLGSYNALDKSHWDHWSLTKSGWGSHFKPSAEETLQIIQDPILFDTMLTQDWSRQEHFGESSTWVALVTKYYAQWPAYSTTVQMLSAMPMSSFEDFRATHLLLRTNYQVPRAMESFELP
jgi:hypothetical protein